jgi:catechol 2,3-dioxygenase-like lactoylglutathione lyase family enzyme
MTKPVKLAHVVYMTRRFDEMIAWYRNVFEADVVHQDPALAFLAYDDEHHRFAFANLALLKPGGDGATAEVGVNHIAFTYASAGDLLETYSRLKEAGIEPYWPVHHGMTLSLYYRDPDGNRLELQVDAMPVDAANAYIASPAFAANPLGFVADPDALLSAYRAGAREEDLLSIPNSEPTPLPFEHGFTG